MELRIPGCSGGIGVALSTTSLLVDQDILIDSVFDRIEEPVVLHARAETLQVLQEHIFNWKIWPDLYLTHMKPGAEDIIVEQCRSHIEDFQVRRLCGGDRFKL